MKIVHTQHLYAPHVGGSEEVVRQLSERLVKRGHEVTVATATHPNRTFSELNGVRIESFDLAGTTATRVRGSKAEIRRYQDFLRNCKADVVVNSCAQSWSTDLTFPILGQIKSAKVLIPSGYSGLRLLPYFLYYRRLPRYLKQYNELIYFSEHYQDKTFGDQHGVKNYAVIPNAAAQEEFTASTLNFRKRYNITTKYLLVTVGNHYRGKGHSFVLDAFRAMKRDDVTFVIIGRKTDTKDSCYTVCQQAATEKNILSLELERPWVVSALQEADLFLFGSKIEASPLVIVEAMAAKTPFITTNCGCVSDYAAYGKIITTPGEMANAAAMLLDNSKECEHLATSGYEQWQQHQTWEKVVDQYEAVYKKAVRRGK